MAKATPTHDRLIHASLSAIAVSLSIITVFLIVAFFLSGNYLAAKGGFGDGDRWHEEFQVDSEVPQAVFLTNGQVYFGTIRVFNEKSIVMEEVYYLQAGQEESVDAGLSLIRLGDGEIHAPQNRIMINRDQVLFWENLTAESEVAAAMKVYDTQAVVAHPVDDPVVPTTADDLE